MSLPADSVPSASLLWLRSLFAPRRAEPSYPPRPVVDDRGHTSVPGLWLAGEVAGTPLIKLGLNQGAALAESLAQELRALDADLPPTSFDAVIVGAGASGLSAALRAKALGLRIVVVEAQRVAQAIDDMPAGKHLFAEPQGVQNRSDLWFEECSREVLLARWREQVQSSGIDVREGERVVRIARDQGIFVVETTTETLTARRVLLCVGRSGAPHQAGVPGEAEYASRVHHRLRDPRDHHGEHIVVVGGGDVACETALALCAHNHVTLVVRDAQLTRPLQRNRRLVMEAAQEGRLTLLLQHQLSAIANDTVQVRDGEGGQREIRADTVFEMLGAAFPTTFLRQAGVRFEGDWNFARYAALFLSFTLVYSLYALKKFPESPVSWPFSTLLPYDGFAAVTNGLFRVAIAPFRPLFTERALIDMQRTLWFQQGYLYSLLYTVVMIGFGTEALRRWSRVAANPRYQRWRYGSLIGFQVLFFLIANVIAVQGLSVQYAWRAWGLYQPWPLFFHTFHWWNASDPRALMTLFIGGGLVGTFVLIPWLSFRHGKRFCTFICGCGGLAETLGDRWRHLA
ncbi:MAG: NAD(P)-binding domain-containing protein, partial [Myxococcota bacterium]